MAAVILLQWQAPAVLAQHPKTSARLDEATLSRFFAVEAPAPGCTFFADIGEIPPGHTLIYERNRQCALLIINRSLTLRSA